MSGQPKAEAKCVECGSKRWVGPGEVPPGQMPTCQQCGGVMVSTGRAKG